MEKLRFAYIYGSLITHVIHFHRKRKSIEENITIGITTVQPGAHPDPKTATRGNSAAGEEDPEGVLCTAT